MNGNSRTSSRKGWCEGMIRATGERNNVCCLQVSEDDRSNLRESNQFAKFSWRNFAN